jgi:hypothetical protein
MREETADVVDQQVRRLVCCVVSAADRAAVIAAVRAAAPEVIVHQLTALADVRSLRKPDQEFAATNELRTQGTDKLMAAAAAGTRSLQAGGLELFPRPAAHGVLELWQKTAGTDCAGSRYPDRHDPTAPIACPQIFTEQVSELVTCGPHTLACGTSPAETRSLRRLVLTTTRLGPAPCDPR